MSIRKKLDCVLCAEGKLFANFDYSFGKLGLRNLKKSYRHTERFLYKCNFIKSTPFDSYEYLSA